ncbi:MAG: glycine dehydrogenase (aminomethyl-transferring), partial [Phycisphaerae bacterium]|nr:glycine dehydrogenase (aminomethyl-transferring) [Phycisphaerae bacterium]
MPAPSPSTGSFAPRHLGPSGADVARMVRALGYDTLDAVIDDVVPGSIRLDRDLDLPAPVSEPELLRELEALAARNRIARSFIGQGYSDCFTPPVVLRNVLQNPGWYTAYTPYQAEIAQGRLEALLVFQTMVADLTGLEIANASLLDEGTAAAEAMAMACRVKGDGVRNAFFVASDCHPQTIEVVRTRALPLGIRVEVGDLDAFEPGARFFGVLAQYPATDGRLVDLSPLAARAHAGGAMLVVAADLLALALATPPGEMGADVCVGSAQRFGVPMGFGGPHAAF